jgi:hypothetical protein
MKLQLVSTPTRFSINLDGHISEAEYAWKIFPLIENQNSDFEVIFEKLKKLRDWAQMRKIGFKLKASFLFKSAFFCFCKLHEDA